MINFSDITYIVSGNQICFSSIKTNNFISLDLTNNQFKVNGIHPFLINKEFHSLNVNEFTIYQTTNLSTKNIINFGSSVCFITK